MPRQQAYKIRLSIQRLILIAVFTSWLAFIVGQAARSHLDEAAFVVSNKEGHVDLLATMRSSLFGQPQEQMTTSNDDDRDYIETCQSVHVSGWSLVDKANNTDANARGAETQQHQDEDESDDDEDESDDDEDDEDLPVGSHLLLDFQGVESDLLQSEERLNEAVLHLVEMLGLFDLRYVYSQHNQNGNLIAGGISESNHHIWVHARPEDRVVFLDLFSPGSTKDFMRFVPEIERLFGGKPDGGSESSVLWSHKLRGFSNVLNESYLHALADLQEFPVGVMLDHKVEVASVQSPFQHINVWDVSTPQLGPHHLGGDPSYEASHPELFQPDRILFLDGLLQSRRSGDAAYHETLVHPVLLAHPNPRRVAIIGGGEGATLREILKHKTIEEVVMIEIDEVMVNASRQYLPEWNDCSHLEGSTADNCFDDERTSLFCEDAFQWFKDRFSESVPEDQNERFDVIVMDALDPQGIQEIVEALYTDEAFYRALYNGLSHNGILISQVGESSYMDDPYYTFGEDRYYGRFVSGLKQLGFSTIVEYEEGNCGFLEPWSFIVASKQHEALAERWRRNDAEIDLEIQQRLFPTKDGKSSLYFFDGPGMNKYKYPSRPMEEIFCRNPDVPQECLVPRGFQPAALSDAEYDLLSVSLQDFNGKDCPAVDSPEMNLLRSEAMVDSIYVGPSTDRILSKSGKICGSVECRNGALRAGKEEFGIYGPAGTFIPSHAASSCLDREYNQKPVDADASNNDPFDSVRQRSRFQFPL